MTSPAFHNKCQYGVRLVPKRSSAGILSTTGDRARKRLHIPLP
jgi:hypothetical protein